MQTDESLRICQVIQGAYPNFYKNATTAEKQTMVSLWETVLEGYTYEQANAGLMMYLRSDERGFPPSPGQVINEIEKLSTPEEEMMTEAQAWAHAYRAICNSSYNSKEEYDALPDIVKKAVGSPIMLQEWAGLDESDLPVIESNFMRSYRAAVKREKDERLIPKSIKALMGSAFARIEDGVNNTEGQ